MHTSASHSLTRLLPSSRGHGPNAFGATHRLRPRTHTPLHTVRCADPGASSSESRRSDDADASVQVPGDWRAFRARLVAQERGGSINETVHNGHNGSAFATRGDRWAHLLAQPEKGCLLIARRSDMRFFNNTVVFLAWHEDKSGSIGLVLNCPSPLKVKDADSVGHVAGCFAQQHVYVGGPVENNTFLALHTWGECEQAHEIISGLYTTDVRHLNDHVASHAHDAAEIAPRPVKVMAGYAGWAPYQLSQEVINGSWWIVAASKDVILDSLNAEETINKKAYWHSVLDLAGVIPSPENGA